MSFKFISIDDPNAVGGQGKGTRALGISSKTGVIVGGYDNGSVQTGYSDFLGTFNNLTAPVGVTSFSVTGINDVSSYVGYYRTNTDVVRGFVNIGGNVTLLDDPNTSTYTIPFGINDAGKIVGFYEDANNISHAFTYSFGTFSDLIVPGAVDGSGAFGINASGDIVGYYADANNRSHGFLDHNGTFTTLDVPGGYFTVATAINDSGQIVGDYYDINFVQHGFLYSNGHFTTFDAGTKTSVYGINNAGVIVGSYLDSSGGTHGFAASHATPHDFYGLNTADVLWRSASGLATWEMNGSSIFASGTVTSQGQTVAPDASWQIAGTADFNADGETDMLWRQDGTNALALWQMQGSNVTTSNAIASGGSPIAPDASWTVAAVGDFTADSRADILWRQSGSGALALWSMNGSSVAASDAITSNGSAVAPDASWNVAGIADFNGDGFTDMLWRQSSGELSLWDMHGSTIIASSQLTSQGKVAAPDASWSVAGIGDFNNDGQADILWRDSGGTLALWQMNDSAIVSSGAPTYQGIAAVPNTSWKIVEVGDFNGDGKSDLLWRNDNGTMAEWLMDGSKITATVAPTSQGNAVAPDANWSVQGKPTMFA